MSMRRYFKIKLKDYSPLTSTVHTLLFFVDESLKFSKDYFINLFKYYLIVSLFRIGKSIRRLGDGKSRKMAIFQGQNFRYSFKYILI